MEKRGRPKKEQLTKEDLLAMFNKALNILEAHNLVLCDMHATLLRIALSEERLADLKQQQQDFFDRKKRKEEIHGDYFRNRFMDDRGSQV